MRTSFAGSPTVMPDVKNLMRAAFLLLTLLLLSRCSSDSDPKPKPLEKPLFRVDIISRVEAKIILLNSSPDAVYHIFRSVNSGQHELLWTLGPNETSCSDRALEPENAYSYTVEATSGTVVEKSIEQRLLYVALPLDYGAPLRTYSSWEYAQEGKTRISADGSLIFHTRGKSLGETDFKIWGFSSRGGWELKLYESPGALGLACSPDQKWTAVGSYGTGVITFIDGNGPDTKQEITTTLPGIYALEFSPDSKKLFVGGNAGTILTCTIVNGDWAVSGSFETASETMSIRSDQSLELLLTADASEVLLRTYDGDIVQSYVGLDGSASSAIFSYDGSSVLGAGKDSPQLIKWNKASGEIEKTFASTAIITGIAVTPHKTILTADESGVVNLLDENLNVVNSWTFEAPVLDIAYHSNQDYATVYLFGGDWVSLKSLSHWEVE